MPRKQPPVPAPATRGLTRRRDDGPPGLSDLDDGIHWLPEDPDVIGRQDHRGTAAPSRDDRARPPQDPKTRITNARSPKKGAVSGMPIRDDLPDDPGAAKRNPRVRGA